MLFTAGMGMLKDCYTNHKLSDFSLYEKKVRLHFCHFDSLRKRSYHSQEKNCNNYLCSKKRISNYCDPVKIKGRSSGRN